MKEVAMDYGGGGDRRPIWRTWEVESLAVAVGSSPVKSGSLTTESTSLPPPAVARRRSKQAPTPPNPPPHRPALLCPRLPRNRIHLPSAVSGSTLVKSGSPPSNPPPCRPSLFFPHLPAANGEQPQPTGCPATAYSPPPGPRGSPLSLPPYSALPCLHCT